jgi:hypothetical protein
MKKINVFMLAVLMVATIACESRSGQKVREMANAVNEKVVVIKIENHFGGNGTIDVYKVRRIDKGVTDFIKLYNRPVFAAGDTILYKFF